MENVPTSDSDDDQIQSIPDLETTSSEERHLISPFGKATVILTVENVELHLQKEHLIAESPVFEQMLKSDLTDLGIRQIPLPGKTIYPFVDFLRFLTPGIYYELNEKSAHDLLPLAHEYQVRKLNKIENVLTDWVKEQHDKIPSKQIIKSILEAEKFQLLKYLDECIAVASRKKYKNLVNKPMFKEISQETRLKISCKRWSDVDSVVDETMNPYYGFDSWESNISDISNISKDLQTNLTPFMQDN